MLALSLLSLFASPLLLHLVAFHVYVSLFPDTAHISSFVPSFTSSARFSCCVYSLHLQGVR